MVVPPTGVLYRGRNFHVKRLVLECAGQETYRLFAVDLPSVYHHRRPGCPGQNDFMLGSIMLGGGGGIRTPSRGFTKRPLYQLELLRP